MTDISLDPHKEKLKFRLTNNVHHWPAPKPQNPKTPKPLEVIWNCERLIQIIVIMSAQEEGKQLDSDRQNEEEEPIAAGDDVIDAND